MALKSDQQGFLIGDPADLSDGLAGMRADIRKMRDAVVSVAKPGNRGRMSAPTGIADTSRTPTEPNRRHSSSYGPGAAKRIGNAVTEAGKSVVNTESDASVKAASEIAQPLKRGWNALRGGDHEQRQEGWLKRIFDTLRGRRDGVGSERDGVTRSLFDKAEQQRDGTMAKSMAPAAARSGHNESTPSRIEQYLKSIDSKVRKPKHDGFLLSALVTFAKLGIHWFDYRREKRNESHLARIARASDGHFREAFPFYRFVRRKLQSIGESIEELPGNKKGGGGFLAMLIAPLLAALAALAAKLAGIPLIGPALRALSHALEGMSRSLLAGRLAGAAARAAGSAGDVAGGAAGGAAAGRTAARWGKNAKGVRANRFARTARVMGRNAGRFMRPAGRLLTKVPVVGSLLALGLGVAGSAAIEKDETKTRDQKNAAQGKNWGGVAGGLGGAALGAALGTAIAPGIGTVIGGVLGAVLGDWLGGNLGEMLGEKFSAFLQVAAPVWTEIKNVALGTWDWIKGLGTEAFDGISRAWEAVTTTVGAIFDDFKAKITAWYEAMKNIPVIGDAIRAAEGAAKEAAETAKDVAGKAAEKAQEIAQKTAETAKAAAGTAAAAVGDYLSNTSLGKSIKSRQNLSLLTQQMDAAGITDPRERASFLAQMHHESAGFSSKSENLNYSAAGLRKTFGKYFKTDEEAARYAHNPAAIANKVYAGRNGNTEAGDGYKYRGRGFVQLTGKGNYAEAGKALGLDLVNNPDLAADPAIAAKIATWFWQRDGKLVAAGRSGNIEASTKIINGGKNGLADRKQLYAAYSGVAARAPIIPAGPSVAPAMPAISTPMAPAAPAVFTYEKAPEVQIPLGSAPAAKPVVVQMQQPDAGQDVRDRRVAHIVTGGLVHA